MHAVARPSSGQSDPVVSVWAAGAGGRFPAAATGVATAGDEPLALDALRSSLRSVGEEHLGLADQAGRLVGHHHLGVGARGEILEGP